MHVHMAGMLNRSRYSGSYMVFVSLVSEHHNYITLWQKYL